MKESNNNTTIDSMNSPPNIERGILKTGRSWRTRFEGRARAGYIILYPSNMFSFLFTTVGLLLLALYAAYFSKKSIGTESLAKLNLHTVGVIVTLVGLYFGVHYVMWIFLGSVGGWGSWYAWIMGHNLDLWAMSLPFVGLPLLFLRKAQE